MGGLWLFVVVMVTPVVAKPSGINYRPINVYVPTTVDTVNKECTLGNGTVVPYHRRFQLPDITDPCIYLKCTKGGLQVYWQISGCYYNGRCYGHFSPDTVTSFCTKYKCSLYGDKTTTGTRVFANFYRLGFDGCIDGDQCHFLNVEIPVDACTKKKCERMGYEMNIIRTPGCVDGGVCRAVGWSEQAGPNTVKKCEANGEPIKYQTDGGPAQVPRCDCRAEDGSCHNVNQILGNTCGGAICTDISNGKFEFRKGPTSTLTAADCVTAEGKCLTNNQVYEFQSACKQYLCRDGKILLVLRCLKDNTCQAGVKAKQEGGNICDCLFNEANVWRRLDYTCQPLQG